MDDSGSQNLSQLQLHVNPEGLKRVDGYFLAPVVEQRNYIRDDNDDDDERTGEIY